MMGIMEGRKIVFRQKTTNLVHRPYNPNKNRWGEIARSELSSDIKGFWVFFHFSNFRGNVELSSLKP
jgi:hypothetical protein